MTFQGKHFPGDYRDDLYVFGISGARRMGSDRELIQNPTFVFFAPPPNHQVIHKHVIHPGASPASPSLGYGRP